MKYKLYQVNWSFPDGTGTNETVEKYCIGSVLNVCCGKSKLGQLRIDLDPLQEPHIVADCFNMPIRRNSFDTVIVDPPYEYFNRFKWMYRLADIARKRVILSAGQILVSLAKFKLTEIVANISPQLFFVRLWYIYDRIQGDLF